MWTPARNRPLRHKVLVFYSGSFSAPVADYFLKALSRHAHLEVMDWEAFFKKHGAKEFREVLNEELSRAEFAVLILPTGAQKGKNGRRFLQSLQNLNYELGAAENELGRGRVFVVGNTRFIGNYHESVFLYHYDGASKKTLKSAYEAIVDAIDCELFRSPAAHLAGLWREEYHVPHMDEAIATGVAEVIQFRDGFKIVSRENDFKDFYVATASLGKLDAHSAHGTWRSTVSGRGGGCSFYLSQCGKVMCCWYSGKDQHGTPKIACWLMVKEDADEAEIERRFAEGRKKLLQTVIKTELPPPTLPGQPPAAEGLLM
jgi:hypothetical protein